MLGIIEKTGLLILANFLPTLEQAGGIPLGIFLGLDPIYTLLVSLSVNCFIFFPILLFLRFFHDSILSRIKLFNKYLLRVRKKGKPYIDKYGIFGLTLFISLPSPLTGTYTATILSWFLDLDWRKSFIAIVIGSIIGGLIILAASVGLFGFFKLF